MNHPNTRLLNILLLGLSLSLSACGFTPMYGSTATPTPGYSKSMPPTAGLDRIEIGVIPDESGVALRNDLIDRFYRNGYPADPLYSLSIGKVNEQSLDLDITISSETTRKQIRLNMVMNLIDLKTGKSALTRNLTAITSYNVLDSQFTTRVGEADAREAALNDLARQIETQISLFLKRGPADHPKVKKDDGLSDHPSTDIFVPDDTFPRQRTP